MNLLNKHLSFKTDLFMTFLNGLIVIGGVFFLNGLIARIHGLEILGEFLLVKRTLSSIVGILLIGMNIGLPNYLSKDFDKRFGDNALVLFCFITIPLTVFFLSCIIWINTTGFDSNYLWIYVIFSLGISAQFMTYALYRGYLNMIGANIFQLLGTAIIPIIVFTMVFNLYDAMLFIGAIVFLLMIVGFLYRNKGLNFSDIKFHYSKKLINYGLKRIVSFGSQFVLLAGIPIYIAQSINFESVAYFNSSFSLVRLSLLIVNPIGMVLLPRISQKIASNKLDDVTNILKIFLQAGFIISLMVTALCYMNAPLILIIWLGEVNDTGIFILRIAILALPFYTFSGIARSPIDAISEKGYNSFIYGLAALTMVLIMIIGKIYDINMLTTALTSFLISYIVASLGNYYILRKYFKYNFIDFKLIRDSFLSVLIIISTIQLVSYSEMTKGSQFLLTNSIFITFGIIFFKYIKTGWVAELKTKLYG